MARYHLSPNFDMEPRVCSARQRCDFADFNNGEGIPHYENKAAALEAYEQLKDDNNETIPTSAKKPTPPADDDAATAEENTAPAPAETDEIQYSFLKRFEEQEQQFEEDFEGFPNRFFNADLAGKYIRRRINPEGEVEYETTSAPDKLTQRLINSVSSPKEVEKLSEEQLREYTEALGFTDMKEIQNERTLRALKSTKSYVATTPDDRKVIITMEAANSKLLGRYHFRSGAHPDLDGQNSFTHLDARSMLGAYRIQHKTDENVLAGQLNNPGVGREAVLASHKERVEAAMTAYHKMTDAQLEGRNFLNQKKYVRDNTGKVATAWMDKKNPSKEAVEMMENTTLKGPFRHVEVDSDVDPQQFADFEAAYHEISHKLPPVPEGMEPELRIRKLGKHGSQGFQVNGLYNPVKNAIAIDVRNSGSFIHEYGHQLDLVVHNNASLREDFREITKDYSRTIQIPESASGKRDYYHTATEVHSRIFEVYAHEKLGIDNRLLDKSKFDEFDYAPITKNPELKAKAFAFFDKLYGKNNA